MWKRFFAAERSKLLIDGNSDQIKCKNSLPEVSAEWTKGSTFWREVKLWKTWSVWNEFPVCFLFGWCLVLFLQLGSRGRLQMRHVWAATTLKESQPSFCPEQPGTELGVKRASREWDRIFEKREPMKENPKFLCINSAQRWPLSNTYIRQTVSSSPKIEDQTWDLSLHPL